MFPVAEGDALSRVSTFELIKDAERFVIEVHFFLAGGGDFRYESFLYDEAGRCSNHELFGTGDTEVAALRRLLQNIRDSSAADLDRFFPSETS